MDVGDILYSNVCTNHLVVMVRRGDGQYFDFAAKAFAMPVKPFAVKQFCLALTADVFFPTAQRCVVPAAASDDPQAELIEAVIVTNGFPQPTQSFWVGGQVDTTGAGAGAGAGVPMAQARGAIVRFTG